MEGTAELPGRPAVRPLPLLVLALLALAPYARIATHDFVNWDDDLYVYDNPLHLADDGLARTWTTFDAPNYYPITYTALHLQRALFGLDPAPYHLVSLVLHAANVLLLFLLLLRIARRYDVAWLAAAIFAVHPLQVESVAWIAEQKTLLSTLFALLCALAWLDWRARRGANRLVLVFLALTASLLSKTMTVTLPLALLALEPSQGRRPDRRAWLAAAAMLALAAAAGVTTLIEEQSLGADHSPVAALGPISRLLIAGRAIWTYPLGVVWPTHLAPVHPLWSISAASALDWLPLVAAASVLATLIALRRRIDPLVLTGLGLYVLLIGPLLGLIPSSYMHLAVVADRYAYLPLAGLALALAALGVGAHHALARRWPALRPAGLGLALAALLGLGLVSARQAGVWRDSETLWRHALGQHPDSVTALCNLAEQIHAAGRRDEALALLERARSLDPHDPDVLNNLGVARAAASDPAAAIALFRRALTRRPDFRLARLNLGLALNALNRPAEAEQSLRRALEQRPESALCHNGLGLALALQGNNKAALPHFREAVRLAPTLAEAHRNLGYALGLGHAEPSEYERHFEQAARLHPGDRALWLNWAELRAQRNDPGAAREILLRGLKQLPDEPLLQAQLDRLALPEPPQQPEPDEPPEPGGSPPEPGE